MHPRLQSAFSRQAITRRRFMTVGSLGTFGLSLPLLMQAQGQPLQGAQPPAHRTANAAHASSSTFGAAKRCILLFLTGGPPQHDTWDPKPLAPLEIRGEFSPIGTNVPGIQISEMLPNVARQMDKCCLVRSVTHADRTHTSAGYTMLTGMPHPLANALSATMIRPKPSEDFPHLGSLLTAVRPESHVPTFAALPEIVKDAAVNEFPGLGGGFLGERYSPFLVECNTDKNGFRQPEIVLPEHTPFSRLNNRQQVLARLEAARQDRDSSLGAALSPWYDKAYGLLQSQHVAQAFELSQEPPETHARYGQHLFGQGCLLGRRLLEVGVGLVAVYWHYEGPDDSPVWDTHQNNFVHLRTRLAPPTDLALAALLQDLADRGLLNDTLVICMGEFGRSPNINPQAGREHWSRAQSILLAGAGLPQGAVFGSTDRTGGDPAEHAVEPPDLMATFMHLLGIPADLELHDRLGRPLRACHGTPIAGLVS